MRFALHWDRWGVVVILGDQYALGVDKDSGFPVPIGGIKYNFWKKLSLAAVPKFQSIKPPAMNHVVTRGTPAVVEAYQTFPTCLQSCNDPNDDSQNKEHNYDLKREEIQIRSLILFL